MIRRPPRSTLFPYNDALPILCEKEMRDNAKVSDDELKFPRRNLELLGEHGFLALTVPTEYGGLGEDHVAYARSEEHTSELQSHVNLVCRLLLEKKKKNKTNKQ